VTLFGESVGYPIAVPNPWMLLAQLSHLMLLIFCLDASVRAWRRGERRKALVFGSGVVLYGSTILFFSVGILWGLIALPVVISFSVLFVVAGMVYELNYDMQSAAILSKRLVERETTLSETLKHLNLSAAAANVGMWTRKVGDDVIWISKKACEIWEYPSDAQFTHEEFFKRIHPDDRRLLGSTIQEIEDGKSEFLIEYRILTTSGKLRWVESRGKLELIDGVKAVCGAIVDITKRRLAEEAVYDLTRRLMNAQENERARLGRELHDDLSQSLALLSIELSQLGENFGNANEARNQIKHLVLEISRVSEHVHQISHELHPEKLRHLGLESALRGFCRELSAAHHNLKVDFEAENLPRELSEDISLCLYRVAQEALQNVAKHSGASSAQVNLKMENDEVRLSISDNGAGFDINDHKVKQSLGLISIQERVRAVRGAVKIAPELGIGTKIEASVPINCGAYNH
ncbi:MAG TPA: PAS domain-containing protein, partial [Pyrinomonadaceae bacterium]|jgi:PAS domain S-box-containing protein